MAENPQPGKIACPHCAAMIKSPGLAVGSTVNCPKCGKPFKLGQPAAVESRKSKVKSRGGDAERPGERSHAERGNEGVPSRNPARPDTLVDPNMLAPPPP